MQQSLISTKFISLCLLLLWSHHAMCQKTLTARITQITSYERCRDDVPFPSIDLQEEYARVVSLTLCTSPTDCIASCAIDCDQCVSKDACTHAEPRISCVVEANSTQLAQSPSAVLRVHVEGWENNDVVNDCQYGFLDRCHSVSDCDIELPLNATAGSSFPFQCGDRYHMVSGEVTWSIPANWTCDPAQYDANDGCHCNCGVPDPDCDVLSNPVHNCGNFPNLLQPPFACIDGECIAIDYPVYISPSPVPSVVPSASRIVITPSTSRLSSPPVLSISLAPAVVTSGTPTDEKTSDQESVWRAGVVAGVSVVAVSGALCVCASLQRWRHRRQRRVLARVVVDDDSRQSVPIVTVLHPRDNQPTRSVKAVGFSGPFTVTHVAVPPQPQAPETHTFPRSFSIVDSRSGTGASDGVHPV